MRRWFATSVVCVLIVLAVSLRPVTRTVYVPAPKAPIPAAQSVETVLLAYRPTLNTAGACWSVFYDLPCLEMRQFAVSVVTTPLCNPDEDVCTTMLNLLKHRIPLLFLVPILTLVAVSVDVPVVAQVPLTVCTIADSSTDEYRADDNRGYTYPAANINWLEQLAQYRAADYNFGVWGTWGGFRRIGYQYSVARSGATAASIGASAATLDGLTRELLPMLSSCDVLIYSIGSNDYAPYFTNGFAAVYSGAVSPTTRATAVINAFDASLDMIHAVSPNLKVVLHQIGDLSQLPMVVQAFPDPAKRALVAQSIDQVNAWLTTQVNGTQSVIASVFAEFNTPQFPVSLAGNAVWNIGGYSIPFWALNDAPQLAGFLNTNTNGTGDGHAGSLYSCIIANINIRALNAVLGATVPEFTQAECLQHAGLSASPTNTPPPATSTATPIPPTSVPTATITNTPSPTVTPVPTTDTPTVEPTPTITSTPVPTVTPTAYPAIMVWHVGTLDTLQYTNDWRRSTALTCAGYANWAGIYLPNADGSYQAVKKVLCWN